MFFHLYRRAGYKDPFSKANQSVYWEGQEEKYSKVKTMTFASRNYPDFAIFKPYFVAIEYKQSMSGSLVKQAIGQSLVHTLSEEYDYVYVLFHDKNRDKKIRNSSTNKNEKNIIEKIWGNFNVRVYFI